MNITALFLLLATLVSLVSCRNDDEYAAKAAPDVADAGFSSDALVDILFDSSPADTVWPSEIVAEFVSEDLFSDRSPSAEVDEEFLTEPDVAMPESCGFDYGFEPWSPPNPWVVAPPMPMPDDSGPDPIAHAEPDPLSTHTVYHAGSRAPLVMPDYQDNMPLFERALDWNGGTRCYETPLGVQLLTEAEAWQLYKDIAEKTTGVALNAAPGVRSVMGIRGAYPGTFEWHGNAPNRFNDTLVLLWRDQGGQARVKEFAAHTDTGAYDFGWHSSSSLRPNRRYHHINGWHKNYNALKINEWDYQVRDDANKNAHWDSDRNGWLPPPEPADHDRTGSGHNIHLASVNAPLATAKVHNWSAGCQTIPGIASWTEFITSAWTGEGEPTDYYLVDSRDIDPTVWWPCEPDGTHQCPYRIESFPFSFSGNTGSGADEKIDAYNCSPANESGPEQVFVFMLDKPAMLHVQVDDISGIGPDIDIHLLDADDPDSCMVRDDIAVELYLSPGRYFIIADTYVKDGVPLSGPYLLEAWQVQ